MSRQEKHHVTHFFGGVGAGKSHQRPERDARTHDELPVVPVAQVSKDRSQEHVTADKNWRETSRETPSEQDLTGIWTCRHSNKSQSPILQNALIPTED